MYPDSSKPKSKNIAKIRLIIHLKCLEKMDCFPVLKLLVGNLSERKRANLPDISNARYTQHFETQFSISRLLFQTNTWVISILNKSSLFYNFANSQIYQSDN